MKILMAPEESRKPFLTGVPPTGAVRLRPKASGRTPFLLAPGGQDYVGENSYDRAGRMEE